MQKLGINLGYIIVQIFSFVILMTLLRGWLYEPILNVLDERKKRIAKGLEDARQAANARANADAEAKSILDAARAEAAKLRADATVQAEEQANGIVAKAREEAKAVVAGASAEAEEERNRVLSDMRGQVVDIAMAGANKIVGESLTDKRQREIMGDFFTSVPASVSGLSGDTAEVVSALPLTDDEQNSVKKSVGAENVNFSVDPDILGGLIIRVGDQVVDDSVAGKMNGMKEALA